MKRGFACILLMLSLFLCGFAQAESDIAIPDFATFTDGMFVYSDASREEGYWEYEYYCDVYRYDWVEDYLLNLIQMGFEVTEAERNEIYSRGDTWYLTLPGSALSTFRRAYDPCPAHIQLEHYLGDIHVVCIRVSDDIFYADSDFC